MIRQTSPRARRGSILIVVIGLLALFAVVGLSFVLYADAQATAARSGRAARNADALPNPAAPANDFLRQLIFGYDDDNNPATNPTNSATANYGVSALYGHELLRSRFEPGGNAPYTGIGLPAGTTTVNYAGTAVPAGKAVPWTYPDLNNFSLSWVNPTTGKVDLPSFFRPDVFGGDLSPTSPGWTDPNGHLKILRPHPNLHPNFPRVPVNADGTTYTGDVANLKFMTGVQANDSLWMYTGSPVQTWRGRQYVAMVAPIVMDLSGRVNLTVAGNNKNNGVHGSTHGWSQNEINPTYVGMSQADMSAIITARFNGATVPLERNSSSNFGLINRGRNSSNVNEYRTPPFYSLLDPDGAGSSGPPMLPAAGNTAPFPNFNAQATYPSGFDGSATMSQALTSHPSMFNPFQWQRGVTTAAHGFGMDDVVKLGSRYNDPKNRYKSSEIATKATGGSMDTASTRMLTTAFSVSQRWGQLVLPNNQGTLGPIDLNRPLPDFRMQVTDNTGKPMPLSATNIYAVGSPQYTKAMQARQNLAMDVFVRLLAVAGLIDGTNVIYSPATGGVTFAAAPTNVNVKQLAQLAVNVVDYIDGDDIMTPFSWYPTDPTTTVFGTELPKLVVNEAYSALFNADADSAPPIFPMMPMNMKRPAKNPAQKKFWVELHNPLLTDPTLPDSGAARLFDTNGSINPYELVVAEEPAGGTGTVVSTTLADPTKASQDPSALGVTVKIRVNQFNSGTANPTLNPVERYLVEPIDGATAVVNGNKGYYVLGPTDRNTMQPAAPAATFPDKQDATLTYSLVPTAGAGNAQNVMQYDAMTGAPTAGEISTAQGKKNTVILRRLANPYVAAQPVAGNAGYNPYVTVDVVESVPCRDRVEYDDQDKRAGFTPDSAGSVGRNHPFAAAPSLNAGSPNPAIALQTSAAMVTPPHTFFLKNSNLMGTLEWMVHLDREVVNATELLPVSIWSPAVLTQKFFDGNGTASVNFNKHNRLSGNYGALLDTSISPNMYKAFDLLCVGSRLPQVPLGGREPGLVNVNMVNDARVWNALIDPQAGNTFTAAVVPWANLSASRTPGTTPAALTDRPFQPYSATTATTIESTLLRSGASPGTPATFNPAPTNGNHAYFMPEPMRKVMNNTTTVSDGFLVIWTVGFFEVESVGANGPVIGKELYERVPGDLRAQYAAVVDRSAATVTPGALTTPGPKPWETKSTEDAPANSTTITVQGTVNGGKFAVWNGDSTATAVNVGDQIRIGYGDALATPPTGDGEWVTLGAFAAATDSSGTVITGQYTLTVTATGRYHGAGTRVSNALIGNPGPQATFDCTAPANRHLVPYYIRMQP